MKLLNLLVLIGSPLFSTVANKWLNFFASDDCLPKIRKRSQEPIRPSKLFPITNFLEDFIFLIFHSKISVEIKSTKSIFNIYLFVDYSIVLEFYFFFSFICSLYLLTTEMPTPAEKFHYYLWPEFLHICVK